MRARITNGGEERVVPLEALGESVFGASGDFPFADGMTIEVSVERGEAPPIAARFRPRAYAHP